jgi:hypothetical protein
VSSEREDSGMSGHRIGVRIDQPHPVGHGDVKIILENGTDVACICKGFTITSRVGEVAQCELELVGVDSAKVHAMLSEESTRNLYKTLRAFCEPRVVDETTLADGSTVLAFDRKIGDGR